MSLIRSTEDIDFELGELATLPAFDRVQMADPEHFDVQYAINPHMRDASGELQRVDRGEARKQWEGLRAALESCGAKVCFEPALEGHPDFVFCANPGLPIPKAAVGGASRWVPSRMASEERKGEVQRWCEVFEARGWQVEPLQGEAERFEGTGDGLWHPRRRLLWGGVGLRSSESAWQELATRYGLPIVILELQDPALYHLDTCLAPIDEACCLFCPSAFNAEGVALIQALFEDAIEVDETEAKQHFACNAFAPQIEGGSGRGSVLLQKGATRSCDELRERGFAVIELETGEYLKSGGSVFCMKLAFAD